MSSGTASNVYETRKTLQGLTPQVANESSGGPTMYMSDRQIELNRLWAYYRCQHYDGRKVDWNGKECLSHIEHEMVATSAVLPPGYYDAGQTYPLKFRKPTAPYALVRVIVNRFTGLLFSADRHPKIFIEDDEDTDDWITGFLEATRFWSKMTLARTYGGAMGAVGIGFKFVNGNPIVEVHDPRWCSPVFSDRDELVVDTFEKLYQYPDQVRDPATGQWVEGWFWYRRVINAESDTVWPRVPVEDDKMPDWDKERHTITEHYLGFCPIVWIHNNVVQDSVDGDPDCHGTFDMTEAIDALLAQANRGIISNCDPTVHVSTDGDMNSVKKGSDNAIKTEKGGMAQYLEITGSGPKAAAELAANFERKVMLVSRCVIDDNFGGPARSEREVEMNYSNMTEQADLLREQYGEKGIRRLIDMVLTAARQLETPRIERDGELTNIVRSVIKLPRRKTTREQRVLGKGESISIQWPDWYPASLDRVLSAVQAAGQAKQYGLVSDVSATKYVSEFFGVDNIGEEVNDAKQAQEELAAAFVNQSKGAGGGAPKSRPSVKRIQPGKSSMVTRSGGKMV